MPRSHSFSHQWRVHLAAIVIMLLVCTGFEASAQQKKRRGKPAKTTASQQTNTNSNTATTTAATPPQPQKKNLAPLRGSESPAGGRATITSDVPLNDYEAYRSGNRYYVVIPQANAPSTPSGLRGRGYDDVQVHKRGNDTVLSFRLKPGTTAHVNQKFNRLEVVFNSPGDAQSAPATVTTGPGTSSGTTGTATAVTGNANNSRTGAPSGASGTQGTSTGPTTSSTGGSVSTPGVTPTPNTSSTSAGSATAGSTPPIITASPGTASLPSVTPALGPTVEGSPVAPSPAPSADQIAQSQPAPSVPTAVMTPPATTGTSLGAVLRSNWLLVLIAALLLITVGLVAMTRARSRRSTTEEIAERETPALEEGALESVEAAPTREASTVEAVAAAETVDAATALETPPVVADETQTLEVEPTDALDVERVRLEIKHVLTGQEYDESVINTPIRETRQLIESELLFALSKRNTERRDRALKAFTEHGYFDDTTRDLRTAGIPAERAAAARKLGLTRDASATPHLSAALEDTAPEVRRAAVEALAELRDPEAIGPLESLLAREEDRKVPHALIQRAIRASAAAAAAGTAAVEEEPPATIDVETPTQEEAVTVETAPSPVEEITTPPAAEAAPVENLAETPGLIEESLAGVPPSLESVETAGPTIEAEPAAIADADITRGEAETESLPVTALPIASALVEGIATAEAGAAERQRAEADAARIHAEQERRRAEEEAHRREAEEERQRLEQERLRAEEERRRTEEEARRKEEERQRIEAQRQREAAEAERLRAEEERIRVEEERARTEAEARRHAEEEKKRAEKEARLKAFEEERQRAEEARRLRAEERERRRAQEERARLEEQERERAEADAARRRAEEAALRLADMRRRAEEEARQREEAEAARLHKEEEARQQAEEEAARQRAEKEEAETRQREELELDRQRAAEARRLEEEERHQRLEQERLRAEEERRRTEEEARRKEEERQRLEQKRAEEERVRVEAQAQRQREAAEAERLRAEEERVRVEEERARTEAEARRHAEEERRRVEEEERQRAEAEAARIQFEQEAAEQRRLEEEAAAAHAATPVEVEEIEPVEAEAASPVVQSELFESSVADQSSFMPPVETSKGIVERSASDWVEVDFNEPEVAGDEHPSAGVAPTAVKEAAIVEHTGARPVESIEEYGTAEQVKGIELATPGQGGAAYAEDEFASVPGGILRRLGSEVASERAAAVTDLARVGGDDAFREISAAFDDPAQLVRDAAARALFDLQADHAASFTRALREAPSDRRRRIGNALASSGLASEAIGHLMGESREKTYDAFSLLFLMSKAGEVQPLMRAIEEHPNSEVRLAVVKLLALSGQQDILPAFRRLAVRGSLPTEVRSAVMEAIYQISSQASSDTSPVA